MQKITDNVYVESKLSRCNTSAVVTKDGVVVIDTPMIPANAKKIAGEIAEFGPVRYVINTEPHGDHTSGDCYFGGILIAHEGTREAILASKVEDFQNMLKMMSPESLPVPDDFHYRTPDITLSERLTIYLGDHTFQLINLPGHTPFQVAVYVPEEKIVFTSDNVVVDDIPYFHQALPDRWLKSLKEYEKMDVATVVPGHGGVTDKSAFRRMDKIIRDCLDEVRSAIAQGLSQTEAQEKVTFAEIFAHLPDNERKKMVIRMNVGRLYEYLKNEISINT
jgi:glyoxylase-like metal-dependent hydrolase (beta-lactamase superfamily II)